MLVYGSFPLALEKGTPRGWFVATQFATYLFGPSAWLLERPRYIHRPNSWLNTMGPAKIFGQPKKRGHRLSGFLEVTLESFSTFLSSRPCYSA